MSNRAKGSRNELKAVKKLEADGWLVYRVKGSTKWNKNVDIFNLWDICAKSGIHTKWIQVKTNQKRDIAKHQEFAAKHCSPTESAEVWVYKDRVKEPRIIVLTPVR